MPISTPFVATLLGVILGALLNGALGGLLGGVGSFLLFRVHQLASRIKVLERKLGQAPNDFTRNH